jgi:hypothetical protein
MNLSSRLIWNIFRGFDLLFLAHLLFGIFELFFGLILPPSWIIHSLILESGLFLGILLLLNLEFILWTSTRSPSRRGPRMTWLSRFRSKPFTSSWHLFNWLMNRRSLRSSSLLRLTPSLIDDLDSINKLVDVVKILILLQKLSHSVRWFEFSIRSPVSLISRILFVLQLDSGVANNLRDLSV